MFLLLQVGSVLQKQYNVRIKHIGGSRFENPCSIQIFIREIRGCDIRCLRNNSRCNGYIIRHPDTDPSAYLCRILVSDVWFPHPHYLWTKKNIAKTDVLQRSVSNSATNKPKWRPRKSLMWVVRNIDMCISCSMKRKIIAFLTFSRWR